MDGSNVRIPVKHGHFIPDAQAATEKAGIRGGTYHLQVPFDASDLDGKGRLWDEEQFQSHFDDYVEVHLPSQADGELFTAMAKAMRPMLADIWFRGQWEFAVSLGLAPAVEDLERSAVA